MKQIVYIIMAFLICYIIIFHVIGTPLIMILFIIVISILFYIIK